MSDPQLDATCPNCGSAVASDAAFCPTCNTTLRGPYRAQSTPDAVSAEDSRNWAMGAHLTALAGAFVGGIASFVGPLVIWLMRKDTDAFAAAHALEALNFNLTMLILVIAGVLLAIITIGIGLLVIVPVGLVIAALWLIWTIQGALAASRGEPFRYPVSIRMVS